MWNTNSVDLTEENVQEIHEVSEKYQLYGGSLEKVDLEKLKQEVKAYAQDKLAINHFFNNDGVAFENSLSAMLSGKNKALFIELWGIQKNRDERKMKSGEKSAERMSAIWLLAQSEPEITMHLRGQYLGMVEAELKDKVEGLTVKAAAPVMFTAAQHIQHIQPIKPVPGVKGPKT